jgi:cholesterol 7-desaturase
MMQVTASIKQIGPGYVLLYLDSSFGPMVILQTLTPLQPLVQKLCHYFYGPRYNAWWTKLTVIGESINVRCSILSNST